MAKGIALRKWRISRSDYQDDYQFREAVQGELASFEHIGERLGVALIAAPIRTRLLPNGEWFTSAWGVSDGDGAGGDRCGRGDVVEPEDDAGEPLPPELVEAE
jgi:hypothetical protein